MNSLTRFNSMYRLFFNLVILMLSANVVLAAPHPNMYLNQGEIDAIKSKVTANVGPWASAYPQVISAADSALNQSPLSVTFQGKSDRQYFTEKPYCGWPDGCRDGQINPNADRGDYEAAIKLGDAVRDLGFGYVFTGEAKYADKAIELIRTWSLNPSTSMKPNTSIANRIELFITLPGYLYGADLIWNYSGWNASEKTAFSTWVKALGDNAMSNGAGSNNFANWRVVLIASAGALLDDTGLLNFSANEWKRLLPLQMKGAGSSVAGRMDEEYTRSKGLHYSLYAINAMIQGAEILRHRNINLYDFVNGGRGLELALDYITPYAINPGSWPYQQITTITQKDSMALYELAYSHYQKTSYLDAITRWNRPMDETRIMGINTLTHANRFDLSLTPTPPSIVSQPEPVTVTEGSDANFSIAASGSGPLSYQWSRDGNAIAGETNSSYTVNSVNTSDNGSVYAAVVTNGLGTADSNGAVLTVLPDASAPTLVSAFAASDARVDILFSEPVAVGSAENSANYQINSGISVSSASLNADGRTVSLVVSPLTADTTYAVSISNVQDIAQTPNTIVAQSSLNFTYRTADDFEDGTADGWTPYNADGTATRWEVKIDEGDMAYFLNTSDFSSPGGNRLGEYSLLPTEHGDFRFTAQAKLGDNVADNPFADYAVVFGFQDSNNYYYMLFNNNQTATQLFKVIGGSRTALATADSDWLSDNAYHSIEVSRIGGAISVRFDSTLVLSANDSSLGTGKVGIGSYNDSAYFDDVSVTNAGSGGGSSGGGSTGGGNTSGGGTSGGGTSGGSTGGGSSSGGGTSGGSTGGGTSSGGGTSGGSTGGGTSSGGGTSGGSTGGGTSSGGSTSGGSTGGGSSSGGNTSGGGSSGGDSANGNGSGSGGGGGSQGPLELFFVISLLLVLRGNARAVARFPG